MLYDTWNGSKSGDFYSGNFKCGFSSACHKVLYIHQGGYRHVIVAGIFQILFFFLFFSAFQVINGQFIPFFLFFLSPPMCSTDGRLVSPLFIYFSLPPVRSFKIIPIFLFFFSHF